MKQQKLFLWLGLIFSCFWSVESFSADVGFKKVSIETYDDLKAQFRSLGMFKQIGFWTSQEIKAEDGAVLQGNSLTKLKTAFSKNKSYEKYVASLSAGAGPQPGAPPPPPSGPAASGGTGSLKATAPDILAVGSKQVFIAGQTVDQIIQALSVETSKVLLKRLVARIEPQAVQDAVRAGLESKPAEPPRAPKRPPASPKPKVVTKPDSFGQAWLKDASVKGTKEGLVYDQGGAKWDDQVDALKIRLAPEKINHGKLAGKYKIVTATERTVEKAAENIINGGARTPRIGLKSADLYPAPMVAFEDAWDKVFPDGDATKEYDGAEILDPQNIAPLKAALLAQHVGMAFGNKQTGGGAADKTAGSTPASGAPGSVELPATWVSQAAQWFIDEGKEVKALFINSCIRVIGLPDGFQAAPMGGLLKDGNPVDPTILVATIQAKVDELKAGSGGATPSDSHGAPPPPPASGSVGKELTEALYNSMAAHLRGMKSGPFAQGQKRLYIAQELNGVVSDSEHKDAVQEALLAGESFENFKAAHPEVFAKKTGGAPPSSSPGTGRKSAGDSGTKHTGSVPTEAEYNAWKAKAKILPVQALAGAIVREKGGSLEDAERIAQAVKDSATYADFTAVLGGSAPGGHHAPPPPPPPPPHHGSRHTSAGSQEKVQRMLLELNQTLQLVQ